MDTPSKEGSVTVTVRLPVEMVDKIDNCRKESRYRPLRSAVIRSLIEEGLKARADEGSKLVTRPALIRHRTN